VVKKHTMLLSTSCIVSTKSVVSVITDREIQGLALDDSPKIKRSWSI